MELGQIVLGKVRQNLGEILNDPEAVHMSQSCLKALFTEGHGGVPEGSYVDFLLQ